MHEKAILGRFKEFAANSLGYLRDWKARSGGRILGYFCTYAPEEIIHAAGFLPARIVGSSTPISLAARHLQSYSCSLVQSSLETALRGDLDFLDGAVFPHTCDSIQRLSDIWAENLRLPFHWDVVLPVKLHTESARDYLIQELNRFREGLAEFAGHSVDDEKIRASISLYNQNRSLLRDFYRRRLESPGRYSPGEVLAVVQSAAFMPKEEHSHSLAELLESAENNEKSPGNKVRLLIAGSACSQTQIFDLFENAGADVVGDDLCTGWRYFSEDVREEGDPIEALADRLIRRAPCPCKHNPGRTRDDDLLKRTEATRAHGVVFLLLKFCDPHAFDYPYLQKKLAARKVPSLLLEIEPGSMPLGALETRLQAFIETLGG